MYAPTKPTVSDVRMAGETTTRSVSTTNSNPSTNDPVMLMTNVPHGNEPGKRSLISPSNPYRESAPTAPASPTPTIVRTGTSS